MPRTRSCRLSLLLSLCAGCTSGTGDGSATGGGGNTGGSGANGGDATSSGGAGETSAGAAGQPSAGSSSGGVGGASGAGGSTQPSGGTSSGAAGASGQPSGGTSSGGAGASGSFQVEVHLASDESPEAPTTVGIVNWSTMAGTPSLATIQFGLTTDYGMTAPVDEASGQMRTLLLGMKPEQTYHFRILCEVSGESLVSEDFTLTTGSAPDPSVLSPVDFQVLVDDAREPGFILTSYWNSQAQSGMVFILDSDGDIVWWHDSQIASGVGKAVMSDDGQDLWMASGAAAMNEPVRRVGMDGLAPENYSGARGSHDIVPVGRDMMAYGLLLSVETVDRSGQVERIMPPLELTTPPPHINALGYNKTLETFVVSDLLEDVYIFPRAGSTPETTTLLTSILGPNSRWGGRQHGVQLLSNNHLIMFANNGSSDPVASVAIEYDLDTAEEVWRYEGGVHSSNFGYVQRLPNGNTLVTYSNAGVIHEVTPDQVKVVEITANPYLGYASWRPDLYGPVDDAAE